MENPDKQESSAESAEHQRCNEAKPGLIRRFFMRQRHRRRAAWRQRGLSKISHRLNLQQVQQEQLEDIFHSLADFKGTAVNGRRAAMNSVAEAIQGPLFDVETFKARSEHNIQQMQAQLHRSTEAAAAWFNDLSEQQQNQLRELLQHRLNHRRTYC